MRVLYLGTGEIGVPSLKALIETDQIEVVGVVSQPDRPAGRHQDHPTATPIKELATRHGLRIFQPDRINNTEALAPLQDLNPELVVVCAYGQILRKAILDLPQLGCLNIHASLLPKYRGASCLQGPLLNGDKETGVTLIWMNEGLDTGDILLQETIEIQNTDTAGTLHDKLAVLAPDALLKAISLLRTGQAPRIPQDETSASYVKKMKKEDGEIPWNYSAEKIRNHIRAMTPWPSAFTHVEIEGKHLMLKIFEGAVTSETAGSPGEILKLGDEGILVATGTGGFLLKELQLEGRRKMRATDFIRGCRIEIGSILS